jgi:hypothetical protein
MAPQAGFEPATLLCGRRLSIPSRRTVFDLSAARRRAASCTKTGCAGAGDERPDTYALDRASWRLQVGAEDHRPRTTFYPWGAAAPTPDALRPKAVRQPGGERPHLWYGVCPHPVAGRAARTSSRRSDSTDRDPPSLLSHAPVSGSPLRESRRHRDIARVRSVISGPLRQSRCDGVAARH